MLAHHASPSGTNAEHERERGQATCGVASAPSREGQAQPLSSMRVYWRTVVAEGLPA